MHISGAERICRLSEVSAASAELSTRALKHPKGQPECIHISVELLNDVQHIPALEVQEHAVSTSSEAQDLMTTFFDANGWNHQALTWLYMVSDLRGAMIVDAFSGQRLEPDPRRGVRASHMDAVKPRSATTKQHATEALILASKVASAPGIVGEICISDDPEYTTGYLTTNGIYHRIPHCKLAGSAIGTPVFLFDSRQASLDTCIDFLEHTPVLVELL